ncbi:pep-cterm sorting domain-containing protein [Anaeramoeba ignava]|uniref:Pep-cterm sorting domain-containing protein n=1 Tax=Anaeramoeba ignava TaxID=1746090 RepID=A0A9Q0R7U8_ANAIG|nr:pep-cterm sorting domain-containing protein [Anaeramoeba ignava]
MFAEFSNQLKLSSDLTKLFNQNEENYFDFEIVCKWKNKEHLFKTHKSILSVRSEYFKGLFNSKMKEFQENKMVLEDVSKKTLNSILNYFYSGKIQINLENAVKILLFSSKYLIQELTDYISNFVMQTCQIEIVVDLLKIFESRNINLLVDFCYEFIQENFAQFIQSEFFLKLKESQLMQVLSKDNLDVNEFAIFEGLIKWGRHNSNIQNDLDQMDQSEKKTLSDSLSNLMKNIRFIEFSNQELENALQTGVIPEGMNKEIVDFQNFTPFVKDHMFNQFLQKKQRTSQYSLIFRKRSQFNSSIISKKKHIKYLKEWIGKNSIFSSLKLGFSTENNGWNCEKWHDICDDKGPTLVIIKTTKGFVFGGYSEVGWITNMEKWTSFFADPAGNIGDPNAFIFSLKNPQNSKPQKFTLEKEKQKRAIYYDYSKNGPHFGSNDVWLTKDMHTGFSFEFGFQYALPFGISFRSDQAKNFFAGENGKWKVATMETFFKH